MTVQHQTLTETKTVSKPWGQEKWIQPGSSQYPFVLKELTLLAGQRTSLQVHEYKSESIIILKGTGSLLHHKKLFDCKRFQANGYNEEELLELIGDLQSVRLSPGMVFHTPPGTVHRMIAKTDLTTRSRNSNKCDKKDSCWPKSSGE